MPPLKRPPSVLIDLVSGRLTVDGEFVPLRPKTWDVLRHLAGKPDELVRKDDLLDAVWPGTAVSEGILNKSVGELRAALEERIPGVAFVQTVPRRGFRWVGKATVIGGAESGGPADAASSADRADGAPAFEDSAEPASAGVIARDAELAELEACLAKAEAGRHQAVFLTGEAGAGKTTLVDLFLERIAKRSGAEPVIVAHGQCIDTAGHHEAYRPVFEALERLVRDVPPDSPLIPILRRFAPTWVAQMPMLTPAAAAPAASAATVPGRMLREMTMAVEEMGRHATLVVLLEDAHWADLATTDLFSALARSRDPARLMVIATMREAEATVLDHPVATMARELVARGGARRFDLAPFRREHLDAYLAMRCPGLDADGRIGHGLLAQTAGNPLFVRLVVEDWIAREVVRPGADGGWQLAGTVDDIRGGVPDNLRSLLEAQLALLQDDERSVLEAASVRIGDFDAPSIASALGRDVEDVESMCRDIARRRQFLKPGERAASTGGSAVETFAFMHATVQHVVADGVAPARRRRLHLAAAGALERAHEGRTLFIAPQLAVHYEAGGDRPRALRNLRETSRLALRRDSPRDAVATLERACALAEASEGMPGREDEMLLALSALSHARQVAFGWVDPEVANLWSRTSQMAASRENEKERMVAASGSIMVCCVTARYAEAEETIRDALSWLDAVDDLGTRQTLFFSAATVRYRLAAFDDARLLFESALAIECSSDPIPGTDFVAVLMSQYAPVLALLGRAGEARRLVRDSMARARAHSHYCECVTAALASWSLALLHDFDGLEPIAARALEIATADQYRTWSTRPQALLGLAAMHEGRVDEGIAMVRAGLDGRRGDGQLVDHSALCGLFAEALMDAGRDGAEAALQEGRDFAAQSGERYHDCEFHRLRAKSLRLAGAPAAEVEDELRRAIELATLLGVHWHRLLAATDLAVLLQETGRAGEARAALERALALVEGADDLKPVRRAKETLALIPAEGAASVAPPAARPKGRGAKR